jgi:hypothetical protein
MEELVGLSVVVLAAPLMKPSIAAYVDENGLAHTDATMSRSNKPPLHHSEIIQMEPVELVKHQNQSTARDRIAL